MLAFFLSLGAGLLGTDGADDMFERRVRPILAQHCWKCHGADGAAKGSLRLDQRANVLKGGRHGPAMVAGDPEHSLLIQAIERRSTTLRPMPPDHALSADEIRTLTTWIFQGAHWPANPTPNPITTSRWWAFEPIPVDPPAPAADNSPNLHPVDAFIRQRLSIEKMTPSSPASKEALLRRVTFDLTGLPPTIEELDAFEEDRSPNAWTRVVDRLLASPRYGERWARHWLDVVAYAETDGHEYDFDKPYAWRYRDYVVRAINEDLPFSTFLGEQIAGEQWPHRRTTVDGGADESLLGSAFWQLSEVQSVPVDRAAAAASRMERRLDVLGRGVLGVTLACARCHDHKFDPISTKEYYALAGILESTREEIVSLDTPQRRRELLRRGLHAAGRWETVETMTQRGRIRAARRHLKKVSHQLSRRPNGFDDPDQAMTDAVGETDPNDPMLYSWRRLIAGADRLANRSPSNSSHAPSDGSWPMRVERLAQQIEALAPASSEKDSVLFEDFEKPSPGATTIGAAFDLGERHSLPLDRLGPTGHRCLDSGRAVGVMTGRWRSRPFVIEKAYLTIAVAGSARPGTLAVQLIDGQQPLPKLSRTGPGVHRFVPMVFDTRELAGRTARLEVVDDDDGPDGWIAIDQVMMTDTVPQLGPIPNRLIARHLKKRQVTSMVDLFQRHVDAWLESLDAADKAIESNTPIAEQTERDTICWLLDDNRIWSRGSRETLSEVERTDDDRARFERQSALRSFPPSVLALVTIEAAPVDAPVQNGGRPSDPGPIAPRGFLRCVGPSTPAQLTGSGRLELAQWILSPNNPLAARTIVNRVWLRHFGRGLVSTPDNFGRLGATPSHPELLDYLTRWFIDHGWSLKKLHRFLLLTQTYQQASSIEPVSKDPDNRWLARMPIRRLEVEELRDAMLQASGNLDLRGGGPSVRTPITPFMHGRDVPPIDGPVDGDRRRTLYLEVRRNQSPPWVSAFDAPRADGPVGKRDESLTPAQALALLNGDLAHELARKWSLSLAGSLEPAQQTIVKAFRSALGRRPSDREVSAALDFLVSIAARESSPTSPGSSERRGITADAWREFAHSLFNLAEFQLVR